MIPKNRFRDPAQTKRETAFNFGVQGKRSGLMSSDINRYLPYLVIVVVLGYAATKILY
jgi:hypothetical protein